MKDKLKELGLTENESRIYAALLELGPVHAGLITRKSGLHRRVVYDALDRLIKKGLVGFIIQNHVRVFQAANPERFTEIVKEREAIVQELMPQMLSLYRKTRENEETNFYKGRNGLKLIFEDQIASGKEILILGASLIAYDVLQFYFKWFDKRRKEGKIKSRIIFNSAGKKMRIPYAEVRYLPEKYSSPLAVNIYADKVAIILWSKEIPLAVVIKNRQIADGYRKYFEFMWKVAKT
jgi:sugar-specific transcriptional regulator TrmB